MDKVGIFYGSSSGATARVADEISIELRKRGVEADVMDIADASADTIRKYDSIIFGTSTWGMGVLQDDWDDMLEHLSEISFEGKRVAIFGTGDQEIYPDTFVDGIGILFEKLNHSGAHMVGRWSTDGYKFRESMGKYGKEFVGLVIDEDNQPFHSHSRIKAWVDQITQEF